MTFKIVAHTGALKIVERTTLEEAVKQAKFQREVYSCPVHVFTEHDGLLCTVFSDDVRYETIAERYR